MATTASNRSRLTQTKPSLSFGMKVWIFLNKKPGQANGNSLTKKDLIFLLRNLSMLVSHGVSLPKALDALASEKALAKYITMLENIRSKLRAGEAFSSALAHYPDAFDTLMISQIKIAERSGSLAEIMTQIADHYEKNMGFRTQVLKKLSYPLLVMVIGSGVVLFLLTFVVPVFKETYGAAGIKLPFITQIMIDTSGIISAYFLHVLVSLILFTYTYRHLRKQPNVAAYMDRMLLSVPILGTFLRDIAVLQAMQVLGNLMRSGFTLADALGQSASTVTNRAMKQTIIQLQEAVFRGERFSREVEYMGDIFPPVVRQLIIVGEQTGTLADTTAQICVHMRKEVERKVEILVGTLEPIMTIGLAFTIAVILLAIYLPMFDMINTM